MEKYLEILKCLYCFSQLEVHNGKLFCSNCGKQFFTFNGVPIMLNQDSHFYPKEVLECED